MKLLHEHEYEAVVAGSVDVAVLDAWSLECVAKRLAARAAALGLVLTIEQRSVPPLAMGNYETVVSVREARHA
jgi:hypothetical protein